MYSHRTAKVWNGLEDKSVVLVRGEEMMVSGERQVKRKRSGVLSQRDEMMNKCRLIWWSQWKGEKYHKTWRLRRWYADLLANIT